MVHRLSGYAAGMNKDVRSGLALVCLGALLGVVWFAVGRASDPIAQNGAAMFGLFAVIAAIAGFGVLIKGVLSD